MVCSKFVQWELLQVGWSIRFGWRLCTPCVNFGQLHSKVKDIEGVKPLLLLQLCDAYSTCIVSLILTKAYKVSTMYVLESSAINLNILTYRYCSTMNFQDRTLKNINRQINGSLQQGQNYHFLHLYLLAKKQQKTFLL